MNSPIPLLYFYIVLFQDLNPIKILPCKENFQKLNIIQISHPLSVLLTRDSETKPVFFPHKGVNFSFGSNVTEFGQKIPIVADLHFLLYCCQLTSSITDFILTI